ncbi:unnamed protein product, partial [Owenia fusiformis]
VDENIASCHSKAVCSNLPGGYLCSCPAGYTGDGFTCLDVNECLKSEWNTCGDVEICRNKQGSYECICKPGFKRNLVSLECDDVDECVSPKLNSCELKCINMPGTFRCDCPLGFALNVTNGRTCQMASDCFRPERCEAPASCVRSLVGSEEVDTCVCPKGLVLDESRTSCIDEDECSVGEPCGVNSYCVNSYQSYQCKCYQYYLPDLDGLACTESNGNWGTWSIWGSCSRVCHGRRTRTRTCSSPYPTLGRTCTSAATEQHIMCNYLRDSCSSLPEEVDNGVMMTLPNFLDIRKWEGVEASIFNGICNGANMFCSKNANNYAKCCGKPFSGIMPQEPYCSSGDVELARGYPRDTNQ